jgi:hypothetical protein
MKAPMSPAKNIASAPRNMTVASQALLAIGAFGRTGGAGGSPPLNSSRFAGPGVVISSNRRAVEVRPMRSLYVYGYNEHFEIVAVFRSFAVRISLFNKQQ